MSDHLRLTPVQYSAVCRAAHPLPLTGSYVAFQGRLAAALRPVDPATADLVADLTTGQVRVLRLHVERLRTDLEYRTGEAEAAVELTFPEWRALTRAYELVRLRGCPAALHDELVREVERTEPALGAKLGRLADGQVAELHRRVKGCKRCPGV